MNYLLYLTLLFFIASLNSPSPASATGPVTIAHFNLVIGNVLTIALSLVGAISGVMLVVGGFKFLTAGGNKEATARASGTITYAIVGLLLAVSSWLIVSFIGNFLGVELNEFNIAVNNGTITPANTP